MGLLKGTKRILIIDDEPDVAGVVSRALASGGAEVVTARSLEAAEAAVERYPFDLVIADITMSGILGTEGLELISFIKQRRPGTRVVITSAEASDELKRDAYNRGADGFQAKPVDIPELARQLERLGLDIKGEGL